MLIKSFFLSLFILTLMPTYASSWEKIKECDEQKLVIEKSGNENFKLTLRGSVVEYFISRGVISAIQINDNREFQTELIKYHGNFRAVLGSDQQSPIFIDIHDYGNITLIASQKSQELATASFHNCR